MALKSSRDAGVRTGEKDQHELEYSHPSIESRIRTAVRVGEDEVVEDASQDRRGDVRQSSDCSVASA